jgi:hypothetical protein
MAACSNDSSSGTSKLIHVFKMMVDDGVDGDDGDGDDSDGYGYVYGYSYGDYDDGGDGDDNGDGKDTKKPT